MTCHILKKDGYSHVFDDCAIDTDPTHCAIARVLVNEGKNKEHCEHWHGENRCKCCGQVIKKDVK